MKRIIICCDGTWQGLKCAHPTNVEKIAQNVTGSGDDGVLQVVYYHEGIGTWDKVDHWLGGAFGLGIDQHIQQAYVALALNYDPGDEIYLFGFSRGAYTVRCLAGMITRCGLLPPDQIRSTPAVYDLYRKAVGAQGYGNQPPEILEDSNFDVGIKLLACFDTVGSLGVPKRYDWFPPMHALNQRLRFHTLFLNPKIEFALHACAIDERRASFDLSPMRKHQDAKTLLEQVWFAGDHGSVGGGSKEKEALADIALRWMLDRMEAYGLPLKVKPALHNLEIDPLQSFAPDGNLLFRLLGQHDRTIHTGDAIHESALERFVKRPDYAPEGLVRFLARQKERPETPSGKSELEKLVAATR